MTAGLLACYPTITIAPRDCDVDANRREVSASPTAERITRIEHVLCYFENDAARAKPERDKRSGRLKIGIEHVVMRRLKN